MIDQRTLLVGYDLSEDFTQISCYNEKYFEPESVSTSNQEQFLIPTVLAVREDNKEWLFGDAAKNAYLENKAILIDGLLEKAKQESNVTVFDTSFSCAVLLEKYFRKTLGYIKQKYPDQSIAKIVVTVPELNERLIETIYKALDAIGIKRDRAVVKSHAASAMYYALNQSKELWMNDNGIFHYDGKKLYYYHISLNRRTKPIAVTVVKENLTESFAEFKDEEKVKEELSYLFLNLAKRVLGKYIISTVYITGAGFEGSWIDNALQELCMGRRVFKGQNLYTKGACYLARELSGEKKLSDYILLSEEMIKTSVWMSAYMNAKNQELMLVNIGTPWFEVSDSVECIFDQTEELVFYSKSMFSSEIHTYKIGLNQMLDRPNRTTRIRLTVSCKEPEYLEVTIRDLGFGEMYPATHCQSSMLIPLNDTLVLT